VVTIAQETYKLRSRLSLLFQSLGPFHESLCFSNMLIHFSHNLGAIAFVHPIHMALFTPFLTLLSNSNNVAQQCGKNNLQVNYRIFQSLENLTVDEIDVEVYQRRQSVFFRTDLSSDYEVRLCHAELYQ